MLTFFAENPTAAVIVGCEIGLWVLLGLGMVLRYLVGLRRTSTVVLAGIPTLDAVLVIATAIDLHAAPTSEWCTCSPGSTWGRAWRSVPRSSRGSGTPRPSTGWVR